MGPIITLDKIQLDENHSLLRFNVLSQVFFITWGAVTAHKPTFRLKLIKKLIHTLMSKVSEIMSYVFSRLLAHPPIYRGIGPEQRMYLKKQSNMAAKKFTMYICQQHVS